MGEQLKRPYEISIWEDRLVRTEDGRNYYDENKIAVIGSDKMTAKNRVYSPVLKNNVNGEKTLTFSLSFRYYDEEVGDFVMNPFTSYLINERKVKLWYDGKWYDFVIKECEEDSEEYTIKYTAVDAFTNELAKTGYDFTFSTELNNNMGTVTELARKTLENTDWQVDEENSDIIRQYVSEPIYVCTAIDIFDAQEVTGIIEEPITINKYEKTFFFYSQINNETEEYVQFLRDGDVSNSIDDKNTIKGNNYRLNEVEYDDIEVEYYGPENIIVVPEKTETSITMYGIYLIEGELRRPILLIGDVDNYYQGYRLAYDQLHTYDPVMGRTVKQYTVPLTNEVETIYSYEDSVYTTSSVVVPYISNGTNFNVYADGSAQGWSNSNYVTGGSLLKFKPITFPRLDADEPLATLTQLKTIRGYLELEISEDAATLENCYANAYFNSGITDNASILEHIARGERFVFRIRYQTAPAPATEANELVHIDRPSLLATNPASLHAVVAGYNLVEKQLSDGSIVQLKQVDTSDIYLDFDTDDYKIGNNIIDGGYIDNNMYIINNVVQTPSLQYLYYNETDAEYYTWNPYQGIYELYDESQFDNYLYLTATAQKGLTNEELQNIGNRIGIFLYDNSGIAKYAYVESVELFRFVDSTDVDEMGMMIPVMPGNAPLAQSTTTDYYYFKPTDGMQKEQVSIYTSLDSLAEAIGVDVDDIKEIRNENCEKYLSIEESKSNCFNILQSLCETFECWLDIQVEHEEDGRIKLDGDFKPIKKVLFKEYIGKENFAGFKYGINLKSIQRTLDSNEFVTKLYVGNPSSEYTDTGVLSITNASANPSKESYILNLNYYLNQGLITNRVECLKDITKFNQTLYDINSERIELNNEYILASSALVDMTSQRSVFIEAYEVANEQYVKALSDFETLAHMTYEQYIQSEVKDPAILENESIKQTIEEIYTNSTVINQYSGIVTNVNQEYNELNLLVNGAQTYNVIVSTINGNDEAAQQARTSLTISDYIEGFECKFYDTDETPEKFVSKVNKKSFNSNRIYEHLAVVSIPANYILQYTVTKPYYVLTKDTEIDPNKTYYIYNSQTGEFEKVENPRVEDIQYYHEVGGVTSEQVIIEDVGETVFDIYNVKESEGMTVRFSLIPNEEYAEEHIGYKQRIEKLEKEKKLVEKEFNSKYSKYIQEGTWESTNYIDADLYYYDAVQVSNTSAQPKVSYTINVLEISEIDGFENYLFAVGDKTYIEDTEFFGYNVELQGYITNPDTQKTEAVFIKTPIKEEVVVSEIEWHLDEPWDNVITVQNYKTQFEDLFQRISAAVQTLNYNKASYTRASSILDGSGNINATLLARSLDAIAGVANYGLVSNGAVKIIREGILITDIMKASNQLLIKNNGLESTTDGGVTWRKVLTPEGIDADMITAGTINTNQILLMDGENPSFRWDAAGLNAYGYGDYGYDLTTFVRFDKYGLYGVKNGENYTFSSLADIKSKAHFGVTWDGFFIKNNYTNGYVSISSDNDFQVIRNINGIEVEKIKIGAVTFDAQGNPTKYGITIRNDNGDVVMSTGDDGNLTLTGIINARAGNIGGMSVDDNKLKMKSIVLEPGVGIYSTNLTENNEPLFTISDIDGSSSFNNIKARGEINATSGNFTGRVTVGRIADDNERGYIVIDGIESSIKSSNYVENGSDSGTKGWIINYAGDAVFNNVSVRGAIKTAVFEYSEIQAVGGAFLFRPSSTITAAEVDKKYTPTEDEEIDDEKTYYIYNEETGEYEVVLNPQAYTEIELEPGSNPQELGLYELINDEYVLTTDITVVEGKTYYEKTISQYYEFECNVLRLQVESGMQFNEGDWCKISNYASDDTGAPSAEDCGLVYIYELKQKILGEDSIVLVFERIDEDLIAKIEQLPGGALISMGRADRSTNYGIGINSSDNYVNLPRRAISLFETEIQESETVKVRYDYQAILGTLPPLDKLDEGLYHDYLENTQGIFTDNIYFGNKDHYITFYTDSGDDNKKKLEINSDKFKVKDGKIDATGGTIGGFTLDTNKMWTNVAYYKAFNTGRGFLYDVGNHFEIVSEPIDKYSFKYYIANENRNNPELYVRFLDYIEPNHYELTRTVYTYEDNGYERYAGDLDFYTIGEGNNEELTSESLELLNSLYEATTYEPFNYIKYPFYSNELVLPYTTGMYFSSDDAIIDTNLNEDPTTDYFLSNDYTVAVRVESSEPALGAHYYYYDSVDQEYKLFTEIVTNPIEQHLYLKTEKQFYTYTDGYHLVNVDINDVPKDNGWYEKRTQALTTTEHYSIIAGGPMTYMRLTTEESQKEINVQHVAPTWFFRSDGAARFGAMSLSPDGTLNVPSLATITVDLGVMEQGIIKHDTIGQSNGLWISTEDIEPFVHIIGQGEGGSTPAEQAAANDGISIADSPYTFKWRLIMAQNFGVTSDGTMYSNGARVKDLRLLLKPYDNDVEGRADAKFINDLTDLGLGNVFDSIYQQSKNFNYLLIKNLLENNAVSKDRIIELPCQLKSLVVDGWEKISKDNYRYTVEVIGMRDYHHVFVESHEDYALQYRTAHIKCIAQGNNTLTFQCTSIPTGSSRYTLTEDETVNELKTYYEKIGNTYVEADVDLGPVDYGFYEKEPDTYELTEDTEVVEGKTYYEYVSGEYVEVENPEGDPQAEGWYEFVEGDYILSTDTEFIEGKTYYEYVDGEYVVITKPVINPKQEGYYERYDYLQARILIVT